MSWLARSIANSLKLDDYEEEEEAKGDDLNNARPVNSKPSNDEPDSQSSPSPTSTPRGVKEDLSEITKTITRQFWGVASFLAPPPDPSNTQSGISDPKSADSPREPSDSRVSDEEPVISGIRSDFAEISGKFRSGISKLSSNKTVSEITKIASNFLQFGSEEEEGYELNGTVGVTEDVLAFARNIAMHPETWLDFPLPDDSDPDDFELSDAQQQHALAVESFVPSLAALRLELCPGYMSDNCFWKIYFVLLHPRLKEHAADILSTPQIVKARAMLTQELQIRSKQSQESDLSGTGNDVSANHSTESVALQASANEATPSRVAADFEMEKHPVQSSDIQVVDKPVIEEGPMNQSMYQRSSSPPSNQHVVDKYEDDGDDWFKDDSSETAGNSGITIPLANDDDVSFSDLEEDDGDVPVSHRIAASSSDSSTKDSRDWVQLSRSSVDSNKDIGPQESRDAGSGQVRSHNSENKESNDWLNVDDIDVI